MPAFNLRVGAVEAAAKKLSAARVAAILVSTIVPAVVTPALTLGGCGPDGHRNRYGDCIFGRQNQDWGLRRKGHPAVRMPNGTLRCI